MFTPITRSPGCTNRIGSLLARALMVCAAGVNVNHSLWAFQRGAAVEDNLQMAGSLFLLPQNDNCTSKAIVRKNSTASDDNRVRRIAFDSCTNLDRSSSWSWPPHRGSTVHMGLHTYGQRYLGTCYRGHCLMGLYLLPCIALSQVVHSCRVLLIQVLLVVTDQSPSSKNLCSHSTHRPILPK